MGFLTSICIAAIATALFRLLVPENKFSKQLCLLITCVFLLTGITAVSGAEFDLEDSVEIGENADFIRFSERVDGQLKQQVCRNMEEKIRTLLAEHGLFPEEVHIIVNISGLYGINISEVKVLFGVEELPENAQSVQRNDESVLRKAQAILQNALSGDIKVTVGTK